MATLSHITDPQLKRQIARNLQIHAWYMKSVNEAEVFDLADFELKVLHGLYRHEGSPDTLTAGSINDLARTGRAITYQVVNKRTGERAPEKTFDVAVFLKNFYPFEKLILNYDSFSPSGQLAGSVTIVTPDIPTDYVSVQFANEIETVYNGRSLSQRELAEVIGVPQIGLAVGLTADLRSLIEAAAATVPGVTTQTTSGIEGRRSSNSGRHNRGDGSDTAFYLNGRLLSVGNAEDRSIIERVITAFIQIARSRGFRPSVGVANHTYPRSRWYMNGTSFHLDIAAGRGYTRPDGRSIVAAIWGGSGSTANVPPPDWLRRAFYT